MSQQLVQIAAKLYECRDAMKMLLGARYQERVRETARHITQLMQVRKCTVMEAALQIGTAVQQAGDSPAIVFAAAVEMTEGFLVLARPANRPTATALVGATSNQTTQVIL